MKSGSYLASRRNGFSGAGGREVGGGGGGVGGSDESNRNFGGVSGLCDPSGSGAGIEKEIPQVQAGIFVDQPQSCNIQ